MRTARVVIPLSSGRVIEAQLPTYRMPQVRKHASGYFVAPGMDVLDLFIGSEGTLGVVVEVELKLLPKPEGILSGVVFFDNEEQTCLLLCAKRESDRLASAEERPDGSGPRYAAIDARALEYFDSESLRISASEIRNDPRAGNRRDLL